MTLTIENIDYHEAQAAKNYFSYYYPGLNSSSELPINSRLNYGYAIVRSAIIRPLVSYGFHPTFGIHHDHQLNAFNLADDFIEPIRPIVDQVVLANIGDNIKLNKQERKNICQVLYHACMMDGQKITVIHAIDLMCESLKQCYYEDSIELLVLSKIIPLELMELITE